MIVHNYERKPPQVLAAQFTGGAPNGPDIIIWIAANGGIAVWLDAIAPTTNDPGRLETIRIQTPDGSTDINIGDYCYLDSDKAFRSITASNFEMVFKPVV